MKVRFSIKDITSEVLPEKNRPIELVKDGNRDFILMYDTYEEASSEIAALQRGYYKVEKIFVHK